MAAKNFVKSGIAFSLALNIIALVELVGTLAAGIFLIANAKAAGEFTSYGYVEGKINSAIVIEGIALIIAGVISFIVFMALAHLCESLAAMHNANQK